MTSHHHRALLSLTLATGLLVGVGFVLTSDEADAQTRSTTSKREKIRQYYRNRKAAERKSGKRSAGLKRRKPAGSNLTAYKASRKLLTSKDARVKRPRDAVHDDPTARSVPGLPSLRTTSSHRRTIITRATAELGKVDPNPARPTKPKWALGFPVVGVKGGADRLAEYNAVAYGSNAAQWANPATLTQIATPGVKHTTWCGIFSLWAVKAGAGIRASDYTSSWTKVGNRYRNLQPLLELAKAFLPKPTGWQRSKQSFLSLQWAPGGIYRYYKDDDPLTVARGENRKLLQPTPIRNWLLKKKSVPPIKPGDIGYTQEYNARNPSRPTNHHYLIDRVVQVNGMYIYFTIEGNYYNHKTRKNQAVMRNYRIYDPSYDWRKKRSGKHAIEAFYTVEELAKFKNIRHAKSSSSQP